MSSSLSVSNNLGPRAAALVRAIGCADTCAAVLVAGEEGAAQDFAAEKLAQVFLCLQPIECEPCGECKACSSFARGNNADVLHVHPKGPQNLIRMGQISYESAYPYDKTGDLPVRQFLFVGPAQSRNKIVLVHNADRMNMPAAHAFLKLLEEPPEYSRILLTTASASSLPTTIRSRCVLLPCDFGPSEDSFLHTIAGGAPELMSKLASPRFEAFVGSLEIWLGKWLSRNRTEALKISEEFQELVLEYKAASESDEDRLIRAEVVKLLANWLASKAHSRNVGAMLESVIQMHRAVLGNVNFGYLCDSFFMAGYGS